MFKRFSTNYMVLLFLVDVSIIQVSLGLGMRLRLVLPLGGNLLPISIPEFVYIPTFSLHLAVGIIWAISFTIGQVYTPRKIIHWFDECQRVLASHVVATLCLAGLLYLVKVEL